MSMPSSYSYDEIRSLPDSELTTRIEVWQEWIDTRYQAYGVRNVGDAAYLDQLEAEQWRRMMMKRVAS